MSGRPLVFATASRLVVVAAALFSAAATIEAGIWALLLIMLVTVWPEAAAAALPPGTGWSAADQVSPRAEAPAEPKEYVGWPGRVGAPGLLPAAVAGPAGAADAADRGGACGAERSGGQGGARDQCRDQAFPASWGVGAGWVGTWHSVPHTLQ